MQCCSNAGPPSSMGASVWRGQTPFTFIRGDDTAIPCLIFQINNFASLGAIII